jgi:hypothetical protein
MIAQTILRQLGGNKLAAMTGAKNFLDLGNGLSFRVPNNRSGAPNYVKITLDPSDTYRVEFARVRGMKVTTTATHDGGLCG